MANAPIEIIPVCDFRVRGKNEKTHTHKHKHIYVFVWVCVHLLALMTNNRNIYEDIWTKKKIFKPIISHGVEFMSIFKGHK